MKPDPIIFRGLKSLTLADSQQESLLRLAAEGISVRSRLALYVYWQLLTRMNFVVQVYSPHTAIDAATGGLGDWLADIVTSEPPDPRVQIGDSQPADTSGRNPNDLPYGFTHLSSKWKTENASLKL